jgi:hypothetical protein
MVRVQCLDHGLAFLKNLLKNLETEDLEMREQQHRGLHGSALEEFSCPLTHQVLDLHYQIAKHPMR